jgi:hypothetical protein
MSGNFLGGKANSQGTLVLALMECVVYRAEHGWDRQFFFVVVVVLVFLEPSLTCLFFFSFLYYCCTEGTLQHLQKLLQYVIVEFAPSIILYPLSPHSWNSFNTSHFSFSYMCAQYFHPPTPFPYILPFPLVPIPQTGPDLGQAVLMPHCECRMQRSCGTESVPRRLLVA